MISLSNLYNNIQLYINIGQTNNFNNTLYSIFQFLYFIILFAIIILLAYVFTKYIANKSLNNKKNKNIKLLESVSLGIDKSLLLIRVGEQYFLVGSSQKNLMLISEVKPDGINTSEYNSIELGSNKFDDYLQQYKDNNNIMEGLKNSGIADSLKRLKNMVRGNKSDEK